MPNKLNRNPLGLFKPTVSPVCLGKLGIRGVLLCSPWCLECVLWKMCFDLCFITGNQICIYNTLILVAEWNLPTFVFSNNVLRAHEIWLEMFYDVLFVTLDLTYIKIRILLYYRNQKSVHLKLNKTLYWFR